MMIMATLVLIDASIGRMHWLPFTSTTTYTPVHLYVLLLIVPALIYDLKRLHRCMRHISSPEDDRRRTSPATVYHWREPRKNLSAVLLGPAKCYSWQNSRGCSTSLPKRVKQL